jgi:hypothetical protein
MRFACRGMAPWDSSASVGEEQDVSLVNSNHLEFTLSQESVVTSLPTVSESKLSFPI